MKKQTALMNHWQLCQYLRKLHLPQVVPPPDLATLKLLQDAHLKYVPYENLDILSGRLTSLEHDDMFAKIIMKNPVGLRYQLCRLPVIDIIRRRLVTLNIPHYIRL